MFNTKGGRRIYVPLLVSSGHSVRHVGVVVHVQDRVGRVSRIANRCVHRNRTAFEGRLREVEGRHDIFRVEHGPVTVAGLVHSAARGGRRHRRSLECAALEAAEGRVLRKHEFRRMIVHHSLSENIQGLFLGHVVNGGGSSLAIHDG